jgi:hypothetical protein
VASQSSNWRSGWQGFAAQQTIHRGIRDAGHVLMNDRVDCARQQKRLGLIVEVVTDHHDGLRNARRLQRGGDVGIGRARAQPIGQTEPHA